jgi:signal transduction histidine kinase
VVLALAVTAALLIYTYRSHAIRHYDEHVALHLDELYEAGKLAADGSFQLAFRPSDPRYEIPGSGWYWEVQQNGRSLERSASMGDFSFSLPAVSLQLPQQILEIQGPSGESLRAHTVAIELRANTAPFVYVSTAPMAGSERDTLNYSAHILGSFVLLGIGLLLAVVLQVRVALKPITAIKAGIARVREGKSSKLPQSELEDVQTLVEELNNLLEHNNTLLSRARLSIADLAHAIKNPLTVINNEARHMTPEQGGLVISQTIDISKSVNRHLSRARASGTEGVLRERTSVRKVVADLVFVMRRVCKQQSLNFDDSGLKECWFNGDSEDLEEMIGNLLDNSCKWSKYNVIIRAETVGNRLIIQIEDDGPGIPESEIASVMNRGHRLDESKPGDGQGLGIVKDLVDLYGGKLSLGKSSMNGLKAELELPAA